MKRKTVIFTALVVVSAGLILTFYGNPLARIQSKELVSEYLEVTFPDEEFIVDDVSYYPFEGTYIVHYVSKDGKTQDTVDVKKGNIIKVD